MQQAKDNPATRQVIYSTLNYNRLINKLYALLPEGAVTAQKLQKIVEFKPQCSYYVVQSISRHPVSYTEYAANKVPMSFSEEFIQSQSLALTHFIPENLIKRMNYRPKRPKEPSEPNSKTESPPDARS